MKALIIFNLRRRLFNRMTLLVNAVLLIVILFVFHADYFLGNAQMKRHFYIDESTRDFQSGFLAQEREYQVNSGPIGGQDILIHYDGSFTIISNAAVDEALLNSIRQDIQQVIRETYSRRYPELKPFADAYAGIEISVRNSRKPEDSLWVVASTVYFLLMNYSGTIASEVVYEKTNHLLENLLTALTPQQHLLAKIIQGFLAVMIQLLLAICFVGLGFLLRYLEDGLKGLGQFISLNEIVSSAAPGISASWPALLLISAIMISGLMIVQTLILLASSRLSSSEQAASLQGVFYVVLLAGYYLLLSKGGTWIVSGGKTVELLAGLPVLSSYLMSGMILMGKATLVQGMLTLGINVVFLLLIIEMSGCWYRRNLLKF